MIESAIIFASKAHEGQVRKVSQVPFILHPLAVGCLLADAGESEEVIAAGILHDTVEDTQVSLKQIEDHFGEKVASLVAACSEDKSKSWEERKQDTMKDLERVSEEVCVIVCADKIHNLKVSVAGIKEMGEQYFASFNRGYESQKWYYGTIKKLLQKRIPYHSLYPVYANLYDQAFEND